MTYQEEYNLLVRMIDDTQYQIERNPKNKTYLLSELSNLQEDLFYLRIHGRMKKITCGETCKGCIKRIKKGGLK